jgi:Mg-chelatase subunit ChlD
VAVTADLVCRHASSVGKAADRLEAIAAAGESPAREALRLAARVELLRRDLADDRRPVPAALERAIGALIAAAKEIGPEP